jgi:GNAT superfamily N-acetyltransferase
LEEFGEAARLYEEVAQEAHRLAIVGDIPLDTSKVFTAPEYQKLPEQEKARFLRTCLADMQFALVFDETFNTAFTARSVADMNNRARTRPSDSNLRFRALLEKIPRHNPAHSMLFSTWQSGNVYDLQQDYFERHMGSTASTGGAVEEYAHHKLLLEVLRAFQKVHADAQINTDLLAEFWAKNKNPIFADAVARALKSQNPTRASEKMLEYLRAEGNNKTAIAYILRRIDDGRILLTHMSEIAHLLSDEETPERFFAATMARLKKEGKLTLEDVQGSSVVMMQGSEIRGAVRRAAQMEDILVHTDRTMYPKEFAMKLEHQFKGLHGDPNARFYTFEWQGQVVSFMTFADRDVKPHPIKGSVREVYFGFFRTNEKFKGGKIGEALLETALEREMKRLKEEGKPFHILAYCDPKAAITKKYLELGFVVTRTFTTPEGVDRYEILLEPENYYKRRGRSS